MPQRRKSRAELELSGAIRKNPARYAVTASAPDLELLGYCPRHLTKPQQAIWREFVSKIPKGVLASCDAFLIEMGVRLVERTRTQPVKPSELSVLLGVLTKLGMTPMGRAALKLTPATAEEGSEWDTI